MNAEGTVRQLQNLAAERWGCEDSRAAEGPHGTAQHNVSSQNTRRRRKFQGNLTAADETRSLAACPKQVCAGRLSPAIRTAALHTKAVA
jgi:hypothetical protein